MDIINAKTLPQELLSICYHYACQTKREFNIVSFPKDPFVISEWDKNEGWVAYRDGVMGEYHENPDTIFLFLSRINSHRVVNKLAPGIGQWLALLEVFLHEFAHHIQRESRQDRDDFYERGYDDCWREHDARFYAWRELKRLADLDDDLFAPQHNQDLGYLGLLASKKLDNLSNLAWSQDRGSWKAANMLRAARLRAIHIPKYNVIAKKYIVQERKGWQPTLDDIWVDEYPPDYIPDDLPEQWEDIVECDDPAPTDEADVPALDDDTYHILGELGLINHTPSLLISTGALGKKIQYRRRVRENPVAIVAEKNGIIWKDKRGRIWRYLRLGQAMQLDLLEDMLSPIDKEHFW